jgi:hypothetical protein
LSNELERSRRQVTGMEQQLAEARERSKDASGGAAGEDGVSEEGPGRESPALTGTVSDPEAKLACARQEDEQRRPSGARRTSPGRSRSGPASGSAVQECLVLLGANGADSDIWVLDDGINTIGSGPDCDVRIQSEFVSRHHAQLIKTPNGSILEDLNSTNGTYLNSRRINKRAVRAGDLVTIGKHRLRYSERSDHRKMTDLGKFGAGVRPGVS